MNKSSQEDGLSRYISIFMPDLGMGGAERVFITLSKRFVQMGLQVDLVLADRAGPLLEEVPSAINIVDLGARQSGEPTWLFGVRTLCSLARYLRKSRPDVLLSTLSGANLTAILARALSLQRFRLVIREASTLANVKSVLRLKLMRWLYPLADNVIALTDHMKQDLITSLGLSASQIRVIGNPVDVERILVLSSELAFTGMAEIERPFVLAVGRLAEPKDISTIIQAVSLVNRQKPLNFVIVGDGPQRKELEALAHKHGIWDRVHFMGFQLNPYPWIRQASVFVHSSKWEGYPNTLLEAMVLGCPIVATSYDPSVQIILSSYPRRCNRVVGVGDKSKMADAILELLDSRRVDEIKVKNVTKQVTNDYLSALNVKL